MDWLDYREKLKIGFDDEGKERYFFTKVFNVLFGFRKTIGAGVDAHEHLKFLDETGTGLRLQNFNGYYDCERYSDCVAILNDHRDNLCDFLSKVLYFHALEWILSMPYSARNSRSFPQ